MVLENDKVKLVLIADFKHQVERANRIFVADDLSWEEKYDLIFCPDLSTKCFELAKKIGEKLDYYNPDASYEEDVTAFISAAREYIAKWERLSHYME